MLFRLLSYLKFIFKSTNQHGVHSPFVYDLVTKCFYDRKKKGEDQKLKEIVRDYKIGLSLKHAKLLVRILTYFRIKNALLLGNQSSDISQILQIHPFTSLHKEAKNANHYDLIYLKSKILQKNKNILSELLTKVHNDSILIIPKPHYDSLSEKIWKTITHHPKVTVTIDSYHFGFVFFRKEQVKEHFIVRL